MKGQTTLTQTATTQAVDTKTRIILGIGMMSAFAVGATLAMALLRLDLIDQPPQILIIKKPLTVMDIISGGLTTAAHQNTSLALYATDASHSPSYYEPLGRFVDGTYDDGAAYATKYRLAIAREHVPYNSEPAYLATITTNGQITNTVCAPGNTNHQFLWFDALGNAYGSYDLSEPALTDCMDVKQRAYNPGIAYHVAPNTFYPYLTASILTIAFEHNGVQQFHYRFDEDVFRSDNTNSQEVSRSPLEIFFHSNENDVTFPARTIKYETFAGVQTLCIPETAVLGRAPALSYFFDTLGTPYTDPLLQHQAISESCHSIVARSFSPQTISLATVAQPFLAEPKNGFSVQLIKDNGIVRTFASDSTSSESGEWNGLVNSRSPLIVHLKNDTGDIIQTDERLISLESDAGNLSLCVPASTVTVFNTEDMGYVDYFYDMDGKPYSDNLLQNPVPCS